MSSGNNTNTTTPDDTVTVPFWADADTLVAAKTAAGVLNAYYAATATVAGEPNAAAALTASLAEKAANAASGATPPVTPTRPGLTSTSALASSSSSTPERTTTPPTQSEAAASGPSRAFLPDCTEFGVTLDFDRRVAMCFVNEQTGQGVHLHLIPVTAHPCVNPSSICTTTKCVCDYLPHLRACYSKNFKVSAAGFIGLDIASVLQLLYDGFDLWSETKPPVKPVAFAAIGEKKWPVKQIVEVRGAVTRVVLADAWVATNRKRATVAADDDNETVFIHDGPQTYEVTVVSSRLIGQIRENLLRFPFAIDVDSDMIMSV